ncbi:hypothetical protein TNIN_390431, partial [Trichonephila inaurata madagascariensis]
PGKKNERLQPETTCKSDWRMNPLLLLRMRSQSPLQVFPLTTFSGWGKRADLGMTLQIS